MKIKDVIGSRPVITIRPDDSLALAGQTMVWANVRPLPVVQGAEVVGVLSERGIFRHNGEVGARVHGASTRLRNGSSGRPDAPRRPVAERAPRPAAHHHGRW
jgi:predicted transcriptional regulator